MTGKEEFVQEVLRGLLPSLAQLREKLREKAKQEKFRFSSRCSQLYRGNGVGLLVNALNKGFDESRMRVPSLRHAKPIRMSGLTRGKAISTSKVYEY